MDHLNALQIRLAHEMERLALSKTDQERAARTVSVAGIRREISAEIEFIGAAPARTQEDDLLDELFA